MKTLNSHFSALKSLQYLPRWPKTPKVIIFGAPNVGTNMFAHRLAIDLGVPAVSMRKIYKTLISNENEYETETFYRKTIALLKRASNQDSSNTNNNSLSDIQKELETNMIPEKLLMLTKYTDLGFVLYDYPNSVKQAEK